MCPEQSIQTNHHQLIQRFQLKWPNIPEFTNPDPDQDIVRYHSLISDKNFSSSDFGYIWYKHCEITNPTTFVQFQKRCSKQKKTLLFSRLHFLTLFNPEQLKHVNSSTAEFVTRNLVHLKIDLYGNDLEFESAHYLLLWNEKKRSFKICWNSRLLVQDYSYFPKELIPSLTFKITRLNPEEFFNQTLRKMMKKNDIFQIPEIN